MVHICCGLLPGFRSALVELLAYICCDLSLFKFASVGKIALLVSYIAKLKNLIIVKCFFFFLEEKTNIIDTSQNTMGVSLVQTLFGSLGAQFAKM
jgi:hypothetical protein